MKPIPIPTVDQLAPQKSAKVLKFHRRRKQPLHQLPFVASMRARDKTDARFWNVPATGGYHGGCETGEAMATAYLRYLRSLPSSESIWSFHELGLIVEAIAARIEAAGGTAMASQPYPAQSKAYASLRGQQVGFCAVICKYLHIAVLLVGHDLDEVDDRELLRRANAGLGFDEASVDELT